MASQESDIVPRISSSGRTIKRGKYDEKEFYLPAAHKAPFRDSISGPQVVTASQTHPNSDIQPNVAKQIPGSASSTAKATVNKVSRGTQKRLKKHKLIHSASRQLGKWSAEDDLALITAIVQTNDLKTVHLCVKFSCYFSLRDIQERWYALLYDPIVSKLSVDAIRRLNPAVVSEIKAKTPFSQAEENLIAQIHSTTEPSLATFESLIESQRGVFSRYRVPRVLLSHWLDLKECNLLTDQKGDSKATNSYTSDLSYSQTPFNISAFSGGDYDAVGSPSECLDDSDEIGSVSTTSDEKHLRRTSRQIGGLEAEVSRWQCIVEQITGIDGGLEGDSQLDDSTWAELRGRLVRFLIRNKEVSFGRSTRDSQVDIDLSLEGPAWKVSRRQGTIHLDSCTGRFRLSNEGQRPVYVDGRPVLFGNSQELSNRSVIEIAQLKLVFSENIDLLSPNRSAS